MNEDIHDTPDSITIHGLEMVYVPAGSFLMGSNEGESDERPLHEVYLDGFYIARFPVTNAQYWEFLQSSGHDAPVEWRDEVRRTQGRQPPYSPWKANWPVLGIYWQYAISYCRWLSEESQQEIRLPTEAEWEKAARGPDGRKYPWGDQFDRSRCNNYELEIGKPTPVDQFSPQGDSVYKVADMAGNKKEWTSTIYKAYPYDANDGREDLQTDFVDGRWVERVVRGEWYGEPEPRKSLRTSVRTGWDMTGASVNMGFRFVTAPPRSPSVPESVTE